MNEEDQKDKDTTSASEETSQEAETTDTTEAQTETTVEEPVSQDIDYKAELERVEKELSQAQHTIVSLKKQKVQEPDIEEHDDGTDIRTVVREELRTVQLESKIDQAAASPEEAALIKFHLQHSIVRTGNDTEDVKRARALANANKYEHTINELTRVAQRPRAAATPTTGGKKEPAKAVIELTPEERKLAQRYNLTPEEIAKARQ